MAWFWIVQKVTSMVSHRGWWMAVYHRSRCGDFIQELYTSLGNGHFNQARFHVGAWQISWLIFWGTRRWISSSQRAPDRVLRVSCGEWTFWVKPMDSGLWVMNPLNWKWDAYTLRLWSWVKRKAVDAAPAQRILFTCHGHMEEVVLYLFDNFLNQNNSSDGGKTCQQIRMMQPLLVVFAFSTNKSSHCYPNSVRDQTLMKFDQEVFLSNSSNISNTEAFTATRSTASTTTLRDVDVTSWVPKCRRWVRYSTPQFGHRNRDNQEI
jgi:hypothetical protein